MVRSVAKVLPEAARVLFPISTIDSLAKLFHILLESNDPSLGFVSILLGVLEHSLTCTESALATVDSKLSDPHPQPQSQSHEPMSTPVPVKATPCPNKKAAAHSKRKGSQSRNVHSFDSTSDSDTASVVTDKDFPPIELDLVLSLYEQFHALVYSTVNFDLLQEASTPKTESDVEVKEETPAVPSTTSTLTSKETSRELIKNVSDAIWNSLSKSYVSERPHLQTLYTYLTGNKVDSFGMAATVVAACQTLHLNDVHLVLSEDHVWIEFGKAPQTQTCEVTWHGKSAEDKRGLPVTDNGSWLYLKGFAVKCESRHMDLAALVAALNPAVTVTADSTEVMRVQQRLLWILYDGGHLRKYPMGIGALAELEEVFPTGLGRKSAAELFEESINTAKYYYNNMHVYPYTLYGGYLLRRQNFKEALEQWSRGAHVLAGYRSACRLRDDEEMYNEYLAITKDHLPAIMRTCSKGISADSITRDPLCYARLLRLFDGICLWEERSGAPIVHIIWAKHWISAIQKFDPSIRNRVIIRTATAATTEPAPVPEGILYTSAPASASSADLDTFLLSNSSGGGALRSAAASVITTLSASDLFCDISSAVGVGGDPFSSISSTSGTFGSGASRFAELAKASGEILIDPSTLSLISALPPPDKGPGAPAAATSMAKSEANNNLESKYPKDGAPVVLTRKDDDGEPRVLLCLFSEKMKAVGELLKHSSNSCTLTLALTAQTSFNATAGASESGTGAGSTSETSLTSTSTSLAGRSRRSCSRFQAVAPAPEKIAQPSVRKRKSEDRAPEKKTETPDDVDEDDPATGGVKKEGPSSTEADPAGEGGHLASLPPKKRGRKIQN